MPARRPTMPRVAEALLPGIFAIAFITIYALKSQGLSTILTYGASMGVSYILYLLTCYQRMPAAESVLPLYLLALAVQMLHFIEEFITRFYVRFPVEIYHSAPFPVDEFVISQMVLFALLIVGAIGIFKQWKIPMVMVWFLIVMLLIVNAVQHPIYALVVRGYFPGLYTSVAGWVLGPMLFRRVWNARRQDTVRAHAGG
jgi:hypothetical protein